MEIGESISPPQLPEISADDKCPFEHNPPPEDKTRNELGGVGSVLGNNMTAGKGVGVHSHEEGEKEPDPRTLGRRSTSITVAGEVVLLKGKPLPYPVTCAAHHLIPAQESLKGHPILNFICKKGEQQDFRDGKAEAPAAVSGSRVWGNVGYNVNGCHNGVWLPGNYAVGGGIAAVDVWLRRASEERKTHTPKQAAKNWEAALDLGADDWSPKEDEKENEGPQPGESFAEALVSSNLSDYALAGTNFEIDPGNPKWAYVRAAMDMARGQFHDRHEDYSEEVKKYLKKLMNLYEQIYRRSTEQRQCEDCKKAKRPKGSPQGADLVGPPRELVSRLVRCSAFFRRHLSPKNQRLTENIYTSGWTKAWLEPRVSSEG